MPCALCDYRRTFGSKHTNSPSPPESRAVGYPSQVAGRHRGMPVARSSALDALRGVAALSVFVFHAWLYTLPVVDAGDRHGAGAFALHELRLGLVLFFVLSGFLLYG